MKDAREFYELVEIYLTWLVREQREAVINADDYVDSYNMGWKEGKLAGLETALYKLKNLEFVTE